MPELLEAGLPERLARAKFDFSKWADGQAWRFVKGDDYESSTDSFRYNVRRWARSNGLTVICRPYPALDSNGEPIPLSKVDPIALGVQFSRRTRSG
ncbi:MAG: hypothetical protein ACRDNK_23960 [Solirubrobacteraceae bacterium]